MPIVTATFEITATGIPSPTYQWLLGAQVDPDDREVLENGEYYSGVTSRVLTLNDVTSSYNSNKYSCRVTNSVGSVVSDLANLDVQYRPVFTTHPTSKNLVPGECYTLSVVITEGNPAPATFVWQKDGVTVPDGGRFSGMTTSTMVVSSYEVGDNGSWTCIATNAAGSRTSNAAVLSSAGSDVFAASYWSCVDSFIFPGGTSIEQISGDNYAFLNRYISNVENLQVFMSYSWSIANYSSDALTQYNGIGLTPFYCGLSNLCNTPSSLGHMGGWFTDVWYDFPIAWIGSNGYYPMFSTNAGDLLASTVYTTNIWITVGPDKGGSVFDITVRMTIPAIGVDETRTYVDGISGTTHGLLAISGGFHIPPGNSMVVNTLTVVES